MTSFSGAFCEKRRLEILDWRFVVRVLISGVLRVLSDLNHDVLEDGTGGGLEGAGGEVWEGRCASSVRAEDGNARVYAARGMLGYSREKRRLDPLDAE